MGNGKHRYTLPYRGFVHPSVVLRMYGMLLATQASSHSRHNRWSPDKRTDEETRRIHIYCTHRSQREEKRRARERMTSVAVVSTGRAANKTCAGHSAMASSQAVRLLQNLCLALFLGMAYKLRYDYGMDIV